MARTAAGHERVAKTAPLIALFGAMATGVFGMMLTGLDPVLPVVDRSADRSDADRGMLIEPAAETAIAAPASRPEAPVVETPAAPQEAIVPDQIVSAHKPADVALSMPAVPVDIPSDELEIAQASTEPVADSPAQTFASIGVDRPNDIAIADAAIAAADSVSLAPLPSVGAAPTRVDATQDGRNALAAIGAPDPQLRQLPNPAANESMAEIALRLASIAPAAAPPDATAGLSDTGAELGDEIVDWVLPPAAPAPRLSDESVARLAALPPATQETLGGTLMMRTAVHSVDAVQAHFEAIEYDLGAVRETSGTVPRLYLEVLPPDLRDVTSVKTKKSVFIRAVLPVVLRVNEEILADRAHLLRLREQIDLGVPVSQTDAEWLAVLADRYGVEPIDIGRLLERVDIVPPSLALAQAAEESGWGTSRFAREGNALFGQYTFDPRAGMVPGEREEGRVHRIRAYDNLLATVRSYMGNLNSHRAYSAFRKSRAAMRDGRKTIDGFALAGELKKYSERGDAYIRTIRKIISYNDLGDFDDAQLHDRQWTRADFAEDEQRS